MALITDVRNQSHNGISGQSGGPPDAVEQAGHSDAPQVLFMNTHDVSSRSGQPPPSYYQVATPKSPHDLYLGEEDDPNHGADVHKESEETERLKYETAKREILDALNLHVLISNKEHDELHREIKRVEAQMRVLEELHNDKELLSKVEMRQEELFHRKQRSYMRMKELEATHNFSDFSMDLSQPPLSTGSNGSFYYHTRSKSSGNASGTHQSRLRPANDGIIGMRMSGAKSIPANAAFAPNSSGLEAETARPSLLNQHHRRNYSSTCLTSNSGVVGKNEKDEAIFKRPDGILVIITCSNCGRSGFTSAQGIVNHARLKHSKTYSSQPLAVLNNQKLLPDDQQNSTTLQKFQELNLDPSKEYLPNVVGVPGGSSNSNMGGDRKSSVREVSPHTITVQPETAQKSTAHLQKLYSKGDFKKIVDYVSEAKKDLDTILTLPSDSEDVTEDDDNTKIKTEGIESNAVDEPKSSDKQTNMKKRKSSVDKETKKRLKPAEKKVRPDAIALMNVPEKDKRSSHYNLRAKSKLKGHARFD